MAAQGEPRLLEEHVALRDFRAWKELTKEPYRVTGSYLPERRGGS